VASAETEVAGHEKLAFLSANEAVKKETIAVPTAISKAAAGTTPAA
jgi:hypothetical protein